MGLEVLMRKFDLLYAEVREADLERLFLEYLESDYDLANINTTIENFCADRGLNPP